ncbi:MAG TPA: type I glyceraldehyde-3-phosphate dehydrogenase [Firmicutes bacterium]|jgi:glyceraldehyde 3-phosphate dehydrogenase|nr:type I glyceraldehyde-3-phosphate dehydrogenase [Bacillota bacterium]
MVLKIGINGFGRIGRVTYRALLQRGGGEVVAINDLADTGTLAHLLSYDSLYGRLPFQIRAEGETLRVNGRTIHVSQEERPENIPWEEYGVETVIESTGRFRLHKDCSRHLEAGARRVIVTAPMTDPDITIVMGVNQEKFVPTEHKIISNASCTTNALAPVAKVLQDTFGIEKGLINTTHAYTNDQSLLDYAHSDLRRARAAFLSLIPTSTGAARAIGDVIPELKGRFDGFAVRVPTPTVSLLDIVVLLGKETTTQEVNKALQRGAEKAPEVLAFSMEPLVSADYRRSPHSSIIDGLSTMVVGNNLARVVTWYDNEWSYSCRVIDLAVYTAKESKKERQAVLAGQS